MLTAIQDKNAWTSAICLGYVEWVMRFTNKRMDWATDDQSMRQMINKLSLSCKDPHKSLLNEIARNTQVSLCFPSIEIKESLLQMSDETLWKWLTEKVWTDGIYYSSNISLPEELIELVIILSKSWQPDTVLDLYNGDSRFLNGICNAMPGISATGIEPDSVLSMLAEIPFALRKDKVTIQTEHIFNICLPPDYDFVFAHFPFAQKPYADIKNDEQPKVSFLNCKLKADYSYAAKAINALSPSGKAIILVSENSLYNNIDQEYRQELIEKGLIEAIVALPPGILLNTNIRTSLMIISSGNSAIHMIDASECIINHGRNKLLDVKQILKIAQSKQSHYALVGYCDLKEGAILSASRYLREAIKLPDPMPLHKVATSYRGYQYNAKLQEEGAPKEKEYGLLRLSDIETETIDFDSLPTFDGDRNKMERYILQENDIVLTARGPIYKVALIKELGDRKIVPSANLMIIRSYHESIVPEYLYLFLISSTGKACIQQIQTGNAILTIPRSNLQNMYIPIIDKSDQKRMADSYNAMRLRIQQLQNEFNQLHNTINHLYEQTANKEGESDE